ncbi:hypothetical protein Emag_006370 [Eimeria magna]
MAVLLRAAETAAISVAGASRAAAAAAAPAATSAAAAAAARNVLNFSSASTVRHGSPLGEPDAFVRILKAPGAPLLRVSLFHGLQQPTGLGSSSSNNSSSRWFVPSLSLVLQRQQFLEAGSPSLGREPWLWGPPLPYDVPRLPVGENSYSRGSPLSNPADASLEAPPPSCGWTSPVSEPPMRAPLGAPLGAPLKAPLSNYDGEGALEYLCNKVRNDKRHRKRAFVQRGFWGRQRRLQLKHERLRLAFAYQGVDLLKLKSLRWGEVSKGPWGSAIGG